MSKEDNSKCLVLSNSDESDCETVRSHSLDTHGQESGKQQVKKRNKALQVRFKDICDAQLEQRGRRSRSISSKVTHRKYMTMPARRSIPNVTKSTGVQTSPDLTKRYKTFPFERKKGHTFKHTALVEDYRGQNNGFLSDIKAGVEDDGSIGQSSVHKGKIVGQTKALLHHTDDSKDLLPGANCLDGSSCPDSSLLSKGPESCPNKPPAKAEQEHQGCGTRTKHKGLPKDETGASTSTKRHLANSEEILRDAGSKGAGPPWNSLTQMESLGSPSARCKRKKATQLNGQQSYTLPHSAKCAAQQAKGLSRARHASASSKIQQTSSEDKGFPAGVPRLGASQPILTGDGDIKAQLQAMENLISSSQETIKVLLGVIQELEKGEAQRGGLTYRTGQDTANCDTCRNSACIIYSVELDFKLQEDQLHPLMKRLCPLDSPQCPALPYSNEVFTSTPKRKAKTETKRHARWKRWFL